MIWALWHAALSCWKYIRRWYTVVIKGWWSATILREAVAFKLCTIGTKGPKCAKKISPTALHQHQPEPLRQGRMIHAFMFFTPNSDPTSECRSRNRDSSDQATFLQSSIVQFWWVLCELYPRVAVLSWQERHPVWSSAAEAHLLQGSMCCVFRDGILHTLVVTSGYLSYCCLSIISLTSLPISASDINKAFSSTQLPLTGYFLFFKPFSVNPRDGCVWKSQ